MLWKVYKKVKEVLPGVLNNFALVVVAVVVAVGRLKPSESVKDGAAKFGRSRFIDSRRSICCISL